MGTSQIIDVIYYAQPCQLERMIRAIALRLSEVDVQLRAEWRQDEEYRVGMLKLVSAAAGTL